MSLTFDQATAQLLSPGSPFAISETEVFGIPTKIWSTAPPNLAQVFRSTAVHGDKTYVVYETDRLTYAQCHSNVAGLAQSLIALGVRRGDRVALATRNYPEWIESFWAVVCIGAIVVPLNAWWSASELSYGVSDSGSMVLIFDTERIERIAEHLESLSSELGDITLISVRTNQDTPIPASTHVSHYQIADLMVAETPQLPEITIDPDDDAAIFYTSGTTGKPKGAVLTHRNITSCLMNAFFSAARRNLMLDEAEGESPKEKLPPSVLLSVPLFHATGCFATLIPNSVVGSKIVLMYRWNPEVALELIERERITSFGGVPAMVWQVLNSPKFNDTDTSSVEAIGYGGAPSAPELVRQIRAHFPTTTPTNGYGMTETAAIASLNVGENYLRKPDSAGPPLPVIDVMITDGSGEPLPPLTTGELWLKGPTIVRGYWNKPDATNQTFTNGWLHSGDLAYLDEENYIHIVDRAKDMVIRGGENIYSVEIEAALFEHPSVADVAIVGIPDLVLGEEVAAIIQPRSGHQLSEDEIRDHVRRRLAGFKVPRYVYFQEDPLPRNAAGKLLKRQIKDAVIEAEVAKPSE